MNLTGNHLRAARALAGLDQEGLSELSGVSINTVRNMEACGAAAIGGFASTREKVQAALEGLGIEFMNGDRPGVRLQKPRGESTAEFKSTAGAKKAPSGKTRQRPSAGRGKR
jgi:transcriptional regulator with XRE-family HTH domain